MDKIHQITFLFLFSLSSSSFAQDLLPVYTDYLTDNMFILHPADAGLGNCAKLRLTVRKQWLDYKEAPQLQTLSYHTSIGKKNGLGFMVFKDKNGYHSQVGGQITYAYHIDFNKFFETNHLSFGMSLSSVANSVDTREFLTDDPIIIDKTKTKYYYNADFGFSYHYFGFISYFSLKNIIKSKYIFYDQDNNVINFRHYLISLGYKINVNRNLIIEPSTMGKYVEHSKEKIMDFNVKVNYSNKESEFWGGVSYRKAYNIEKYEDANYLTSHIGVNYNNFIFSYSYSFQHNNTIFSKGDFHQITLGMNISCDK
jgi:type IX secretion system PorP/SprF family membrane protein